MLLAEGGGESLGGLWLEFPLVWATYCPTFYGDNQDCVISGDFCDNSCKEEVDKVFLTDVNFRCVSFI